MNDFSWKMLFESVRTWLLSAASKLLYAALILILAYVLIRILKKTLKRIFERSKADEAAAGFIISVIKYVCWGIAIIAAIGNIINLSNVVTALGAAGLTASFALQGSLSNFVSGVQIIFSRPFAVGDYLSVETYEGSVIKIDMLNTTLHTFDNKEVIIPNSKMTTDVVVNFSSQENRRLDLSYYVSFDTDLTAAKSVLYAVVDADKRVVRQPDPLIAVGKYGDNGIELVVKFWVPTKEYWNIYFDMQEKVKSAFDTNAIKIPLPQLEVHASKN